MSKRKKEKRQEKGSAQPKAKMSEPSQQKTVRYLAILAGLLGFLLYANTLGHDFAFDDYSVINKNWVTQKGIDGIGDILTSSYRYGYSTDLNNLYRPLSRVMFAIEWEIAPNSPGLHHWINVLLYALTGGLLFLTLQKVLSKYPIGLSFLATVLFLAHPIHTEVVANIKSRDELLAFLFLLLTVQLVWRYLKTQSFLWLALAGAAYFFAFLSKESAITFLLIFPLLIWYFTAKPIKTNLLVLGVLLVPAAAYLAIRKGVLGSIASSGEVSLLSNFLVAAPDLGTKWATAFMLLGKYFWLLLFPHPLVSDYNYNQIPLVGWGNVKVIVAFALYLGLAGFAFYQLRKKRLLSFAILFFLINLFIYSNLIFTIGAGFGERFLYVPSLGFTLAVCTLLWMAFKLPLERGEERLSLDRVFKTIQKPLWVVGGIVVVFAFKTISRNSDWKDNTTLYGKDVQQSTNSATLHAFYAMELMNNNVFNGNTPALRNQNLNKAIQELNTAIAIHPDYASALERLGMAYYQSGDKEKALAYYKLSVKANPESAMTYNNMGILYFEAKDYDIALQLYQNAIALQPDYADALRNLGSTYGSMGKPQEALKAFQEALKYDPNNPMVHLYLGHTYKSLGNEAQSQYHYNLSQQLSAK